MRARWVVAFLMALPIGLGLAAPAVAAGADSLTLAASHTSLDYGQSAALSGDLSSATPGGQPVSIRDAAGTEVAATTTDGSGHYSVGFSPAANVSLRAVSGLTESPPVDLRV
ncbi:MAG: hypothetical protein ACRDHB_05100, partial [Actinomycetota bacterium]